MRTFKIVSVFTVLAVLAAAAPSSALLSDTEYFDFDGWDPDLVSSAAGQDFVLDTSCGPIGVNVKADGDLTTPATYAAGWIRSGHLEANDTNRFRFTFDTNFEMVVKTATVDAQENFDIIGVGPESYFHDAGAVPTTSPIGASGITLMGTGVGQGPGGASFGETITGVQAGLPVILRHDSLDRPNKWEFFMVGKVVPEPSTYSLLGLSLLGMLSLRKRG